MWVASGLFEALRGPLSPESHLCRIRQLMKLVADDSVVEILNLLLGLIQHVKGVALKKVSEAAPATRGLRALVFQGLHTLWTEEPLGRRRSIGSSRGLSATPRSRGWGRRLSPTSGPRSRVRSLHKGGRRGGQFGSSMECRVGRWKVPFCSLDQSCTNQQHSQL